jgi:hypothetical protein
MRFASFLLAAGLVLPVSDTLAEPLVLAADPRAGSDASSFSANELRRVVSGKTIYLDVSGFELPIHYFQNGHMSGTMSSVAAALSWGEVASDNGQWWIEANQLCQRWTSWLNGQTYCYKLARQGDTVQWSRNDGRSGAARIGN